MTVTDDGVRAHEFVQASMNELRRFARSRLKRYDVPSGRLDADDVVQYTVAEMLDRWHEIQNPRQYMFTVARRCVLRAVHEGRRFSEDQPDHHDGEMPGEAVARPADDAAFERIMAGDLYTALQGLTPQQRRAVVLIELGDLSRAATAAEMAVTTGAVSAHRDRGLKRLRKILRRQGGHLLTAAAVLASILVPYARGRSGDFNSADGSGTFWADLLTVEVSRPTGLFVGAAAALVALLALILTIRRGVVRRVGSGFGGSPKPAEPVVRSPGAVPDPTIEMLAHDLRRLDRQRRGETPRESQQWSDAILRAYDERLSLACRHFGVTEHLGALEGMDREIERLRVESALEAAGLDLR